MDAVWKGAFEDLEAALRVFGPQPSKEIITRLTGQLSRDDVWGVIRHAEKIGMIEPVKTPFDSGEPLEQHWGLVEGFDLSKVGMDARVRPHMA